ncbi:hypothetical protein MUP77_04905 [Candidatus Bathyarchaeota archaeon]|nr:hypothetical protein [Candidatus Bathyarchaeota archaeon]
MSTDQRLTWTVSDYLCTECKEPLYLELKSDNKDGVCVNPHCKMSIPHIKFLDISNEKRLEEDERNLEKELHKRIAETDRLTFIQYLFTRRHNLVKSLFQKSILNFRELLAIDDLLIRVCSNTPVGRNVEFQAFESILRGHQEYFSQTCFIEDLENKRYLMSTNNRVYALKYWLPFLDFFKNYGIVGLTNESIPGVFRYIDIDSEVREDFNPNLDNDFGDYFQQLFDFIIELIHMFEYHYLTAKQHRYDPTGIDIATISAFYFSLTQEVDMRPFGAIKKQFKLISRGKEDFREFHDKYISGKSLAPLIVFDGENYLLDKYTLLLYLHYLHGTNKRISPGQNRAGADDLNIKRDEAGDVFEKRVRAQIRNAGFAVQDKPITIKEQGEEHEYDAARAL